MGEAMFLPYGRGNGDLLQKGLCQHAMPSRTAAVNVPDPESRSTHDLAGDSWTLTGRSDSVSWGPCSFLLGPGAHKVLFVPSKSLCFPSPVEVLESNPTGLQSQIPWGFSVPLLYPQVGKSVVEPRTFTTERVLQYNCSPVC